MPGIRELATNILALISDDELLRKAREDADKIRDRIYNNGASASSSGSSFASSSSSSSSSSSFGHNNSYASGSISKSPSYRAERSDKIRDIKEQSIADIDVSESDSKRKDAKKKKEKKTKKTEELNNDNNDDFDFDRLAVRDVGGPSRAATSSQTRYGYFLS